MKPCLALLLFFCLSVASAQPVRDRVLDEVTISHTDGHHVIEIRFPFRFRYRSHFPTNNGNELRVLLQPINVPASDISAVFKRESVVPRYAETIALDEVIYEGDIEPGAQLTLRFTGNVSYEVIPGSDYTHIRIVVLAVN